MLSTFYKLMFDISCYFTFASFLFSYMFGMETDSLVFGVFLVAALVISFGEQLPGKGSMVALGGILVPVLAYLRAETTFEMMEVLLPWIYLVIVFIKKSYGIYHEYFIMRFKVLLCGLSLPVILYLFDTAKGEPAVEVCIPYLIVFLVSGVLLLQLLRYQEGRGSKKMFERHQMKQLVAFCAVCVLLTVGNLLELLVNCVIKPLFLWLVSGAVGVFYFFLARLPKSSQGKFTDKSDWNEFLEETPMFKDLPKNGWSQYGEMVEQQLEETSPVDYTVLFMIAIIFIAVLLFVVMSGTVKKKKKAPAIEDEREELLETEPPMVKLRKRSVHPELVVRYYYRTFIKFVDGKKQKISRYDTTADIADKHGKMYPQKAVQVEELTEIYRKARYSGKDVTQQDATRMKNLVKGM